ncbi:MAG TPA: sigma-70 family RNA polymerase sigma factor [Candidatus Hydrogenedentes bacterium]|nr:sigma-70 family RNA polymerase sigma factor [Candidatus Hydrogenedentota bacterium]HOV73091.1 sigma-70 family RNA polymerase sigma factor [Candidatus Hydrogenedentota bacterium]HPC16191.1 sigma-70 family RNA polymerase sigma factor [Candidatus Hydrogenedentota bacterium]HRT18597.1 sigma-70 family RNA polymerase sigma factor [Candidatus Hydrogenedentota bacterium]HRT63616.1 sigma-70 family RNA polymerase sigma factor [Candidatus Hydrogenedentota bacterium]
MGVRTLQDAYAEYDRLIAPIEDKMIKAIWRVTRNGEDAEEALRIALATIWRRWNRIAGHANPEALVIRICLNASHDVLRGKSRRRRHEASIHANDRAFLESQPAAGPAPDEAAVLREQESAVLHAISRLSHNQAAAVLMRLVQGRSYGDIAQALGCKDATVRKHIERGRERLRRMLEPFVASCRGEAVL